jgi:hypothetical protein
MMVRSGAALMSGSGRIDEEGKLVMEAGEKTEKRRELPRWLVADLFRCVSN